MDKPVRLELASCEPTTGVAVIEERSLSARVVRAVTVLGGCWVAAAVCIFVPILHFVLVPGLLVTGVVLAALRAREDVSLVQVKAACPRCRSERTYACSGRWRDGRSVHCDGCGNAFTLHALAP